MEKFCLLKNFLQVKVKKITLVFNVHDNRIYISPHLLFVSFQYLIQCMCGNNMSVPLLTNAVTVSGTEKETAVVSENLLKINLLGSKVCITNVHLYISVMLFQWWMTDYGFHSLTGLLRALPFPSTQWNMELGIISRTCSGCIKLDFYSVVDIKTLIHFPSAGCLHIFYIYIF